jgi:hypothetical protein
MRASRDEIQQEALSRAVCNQSLTNWPTIFQGFMAKGIPETDIRPRENVFTYHAWRALGRQVRRGEHGVKVTTWVPAAGKEETDPTTGEKKQGRAFSVCKFATVFHVSQTDPIETGKQSRPRHGDGTCAYLSARDRGPDPVDSAFEDRCAELAGINPFGAPE